MINIFTGKNSLMLEYFKKYKKLIRFLFGGAIITFLQIVLLYVFSDAMHLWYLFSSQLSFVIAFFVSFFLYRGWVFPGGDKDSHHQFLLYSALTLVNFLMNGLMMFVFVEWIGLWYIYSQVLVKIIISILNFFCYNLIIFSKE